MHRKKYLTLFEIAAEITEEEKTLRLYSKMLRLTKKLKRRKLSKIEVNEERDKEISEIRELNEPKPVLGRNSLAWER